MHFVQCQSALPPVRVEYTCASPMRPLAGYVCMQQQQPPPKPGQTRTGLASRQKVKCGAIINWSVSSSLGTHTQSSTSLRYILHFIRTKPTKAAPSPIAAHTHTHVHNIIFGRNFLASMGAHTRTHTHNCRLAWSSRKRAFPQQPGNVRVQVRNALAHTHTESSVRFAYLFKFPGPAARRFSPCTFTYMHICHNMRVQRPNLFMCAHDDAKTKPTHTTKKRSQSCASSTHTHMHNMSELLQI